MINLPHTAFTQSLKSKTPNSWRGTHVNTSAKYIKTSFCKRICSCFSFLSLERAASSVLPRVTTLQNKLDHKIKSKSFVQTGFGGYDLAKVPAVDVQVWTEMNVFKTIHSKKNKWQLKVHIIPSSGLFLQILLRKNLTYLGKRHISRIRTRIPSPDGENPRHARNDAANKPHEWREFWSRPPPAQRGPPSRHLLTSSGW